MSRVGTERCGKLGSARGPGAPVPAPDDIDAPWSGTAVSTFTLVQMTVCLSGLADYFDAAGYPSIVDEAGVAVPGS